MFSFSRVPRTWVFGPLISGRKCDPLPVPEAAHQALTMHPTRSLLWVLFKTVYFDYEDDEQMGKERGKFLSLTNREGLLLMRQRGYDHVKAMIENGELDCIQEAALPSLKPKGIQRPVPEG